MKDHIRQSNLIEGIDDLKEDKQSLYAWEWLKDQERITNGVVCHLHKLITLNQLAGPYKGYYRDITQSSVRVGTHFPPHYSEVPYLMQIWTDELFAHSPKENHIEFERIHPFVDGNGRTGRMLMWLQELRLGHKATLIKNKEKQEYYKWFQD